MMPLDRAVALVGSVSELARRLDIAANTPLMWRKRNSVPAEYCPAIEDITCGMVTCEELRPDVKWAVLRNRRKTDRRQGERRGEHTDRRAAVITGKP